MILLVDHRDSFTYNIYHLLLGLGQRVKVVDHREARPAEALGYRAVILGPGPHGPGDVPGSLLLYRSLRGKVPVLGICLGHQIIGVAEGGFVRRAARVRHGVISEIFHENRGLFRGLANPASFVRYHSLVLGEPLPEDLRITARDEDGDIAALEHRRFPVWGIQFHPESALSEEGKGLLENFLGLGR